MNAFQISICRWMSTTLVVFGILGRSESFTLTRKPANPTVVVEGVNSTQVELVWDFTATSNYIAIISRQRIGDLEATPIAARTQSTGFVLEDPSFSTKYEPSLNATLVIKNVNRTDEYRYSLRVLTTLGSQRLADVVTVNFLFAPEFTNVSSDQVVLEGEDPPTVTLRCIAIGEPTPTITWTRVLDNGSDSNELSSSGERLELDKNRNTTGTYRCTAYNGIGTAPNRTINVDVNYKPENIMLMINDSNICQGEVISITCSADGKPDVHTYQLFENDVLVNDVGSSGVWHITMSAEGDVTYRCVANNTVGTSSRNVTFSVNVPSRVYRLENITVTEGENRNLTCNVSGSPVLDVTWTAVNSGSRTIGITRELTNINRNDAGEYKCEASNSCENDTASTFLTVHYKPENFQFAASKEKVCKNEVITFTCSADGNPAVDTYQLFVNDTLVSDGINSHGMWNRTMSVGGVFIYKCVANNTAGTGQSETVNVTVNVHSSIASINNETVTEFENVTLSCQCIRDSSSNGVLV
ncbi:hypothetical protein ACROYT_G028345 [Oculina patagonica]